jgi:hypothetical protein
LVSGHAWATTADLDRIKRVALDYIPAVRRTVLRTVARMAIADETLTTAKVAQGVQYSTATIRRALEDLQALSVMVTKGRQGVADRWAVRDEWHMALDTLRAVESALHTRHEENLSPTVGGGTTHILGRREALL